MSAEDQQSRHEWLAWAAVLLLAAVLRGAGLGLLPLTAGEADRALAAQSLIQGAAPQTWNEPTLEALIAGAFFLFGTDDAVARLVPALAGVLAVAMVWWFRPQWGRWPALGTAALLAGSPAMVAYSRTVGPESLVTVLLLGLLWAIERLARVPEPWVLTVLLVDLALLLHLGTTGISALLVVAAVTAARWGLSGCDLPASLKDALDRDWRRVTEAATAFLIPFTLVSSGFLLHPNGFGIPSLAAWLNTFEGNAAAPGGFAWLKLALYEPAAVGLGLLGAALALRRPRGREGPSTRLLWAVGGLLAIALLPDTDGGVLLAALLPLLLLGGAALGYAWDAMDPAAWRRLGLAAPVAAVLGGLVLLAGLRLTAPPGGGTTEAILALITLALLATLVLWPQDQGPLLPYPAATLLLAGALLAANIHSLTHLNFVAGTAEWFGEPRPDAGTLTALRTMGLRTAAAAPHLLDAASLAVDQRLPSPVRWSLRDQGGVSYVSNPGEGPVLVLTAGSPERPGLPGYSGRSLPLETHWRPDRIDIPRLWRWFMVREPYGGAPAEQRVTLYRRS